MNVIFQTHFSNSIFWLNRNIIERNHRNEWNILQIIYQTIYQILFFTDKILQVTNQFNMLLPVLSQCNIYLYTIWQ